MMHFLNSFILLLFVASLFCISWYKITRGWVGQLPDGTEKKQGEIFGGWQRYFEQVLSLDKIYFNEENIAKAHIELSYLKKSISDKFLSDKRNHFVLKEGIVITDNELIEMERLLSCKIHIEQHTTIVMNGNDESELEFNIYALYNEYPVYRFNDFIRKPLSACIRCYATPYGSIIYWGAIISNNHNFNWSLHKTLSLLFFWIIFVLVLSEINVFLFKKSKL